MRYATTGQPAQARAALSTVLNRYRAMAMTFWLLEAEGALAQVEGLRSWKGSSGYPFSPGHYVTSITYRESLMALPGQGQLIDLR
jgi:hypothetical protein